MIANQLVVSSREAIDQADLERLLIGTGWQVRSTAKNALVATLERSVFDLDTVSDGIDLLTSPLQEAFDASVGPNHIYYAMRTTPNDAAFFDCWGLDSAQDHDIDAPEGWDILKDAPEIVVAIVDSGVRYSHADLASNLWRNQKEIAGNGIDDEGNGYVDDVFGINTIVGGGDPSDDYGHGSHVAGIVGAEGNNGIGISGVAWSVQLMPIKFLNASGRGTLDDAIEAIDYALDHGAKLINASWGGQGYAPSLEQAMERARLMGVAIVAAAGNESRDNDEGYSYPASSELSNVVSVASSTRAGDKSGFSNFGIGTTDLVAPGDEILSTWFDDDNAYSLESGTSMSAPFVTGILALNLALRPEDSLKTQIDRLIQSSKKRQGLRMYSQSGGIVSLSRSLAMDNVLYLPEVVSTSPLTVSRLPGESVTMSVKVASEQPVDYQWRFAGVALDGANSSSLTIESVDVADDGTYALEATNADGSVSVEFHLRVLVSDTQLLDGLDGVASIKVFSRDDSPWTRKSDTLSRGGDHIVVDYPETKYGLRTLSAIVKGPGDLRFLWKISGGNNYQGRAICTVGEDREYISAYRGEWEVGRFRLTEKREYEVVWEWQDSGNREAEGGQLLIDYFKIFPIGQVPPIVYRKPPDLTAQPFSDVWMHVAVEGEDLSFEWHKDGVKLIAENSPHIRLREVQKEDEGHYHVVARNPFGEDESNKGLLTVDESQTPARFVEHSASFSGKLGSKLTIGLEHVGTPPITYKWFRDVYELPGETGPNLTFEKLRMEDAGNYRLSIVNPYGNERHSDRISVSVSDKELSPSILLSERDLVTYRVKQGAPFEIDHFLEYKADTNKYQWYLNGLPLAGQTSLNLKIDSFGADDTGIYEIEVKNGAGSFRDDVLLIKLDFGPGDALDIEGYEWASNNHEDYGWWYTQRNAGLNGGDALEFAREYEFKGPSTYDDGGFSTAVVTHVTGPKNLSVWWKRTSTDGWFEAYVASYNGRTSFNVPIYRFTEAEGELGEWQKSSIHVPAGTHEVRWNFVGLDPTQRGWLDMMQETLQPAIVGYVPKEIVSGTEMARVRVPAWGQGEISYQWYKNSAPIAGATGEELSVESHLVNPDDEYYVVASSEHGQTASSIVRFIPIDDVFALNGVAVNFGENSEWEPNINDWSPGLVLVAEPGQSASIDFLLDGPATMAFDRNWLKVELDGANHEVKEWTNSGIGYGEYIQIPEGSHKVTFRGASSLESYRVHDLSSLSITSPVFIETGKRGSSATAIGGYREKFSIFFAADLPASVTWYKDGELVKKEDIASTYLTYSYLFEHDAEPPSLSDVGTYYCEVTDANGVTKRSEDFELTALDLATLGEILGDPAFVAPFDYNVIELDEEVFLDGGASARIRYLKEWEHGWVQLYNSDRVGDSYAASEFYVRMEGYDAETAVSISDGAGSLIRLSLEDGWQKVSLQRDSGNIYFGIKKGTKSALTVWIDGAKSIEKLRILDQPKHYATYLGGKVEFSVRAFSKEPVRYQWRHNQLPIEGATSNRLEISSMGFEHLGQYDVVLESGMHRVTSKPATLSVVEDLGAALEVPGLRVTTWGDALWKIDKTHSVDGTHSLKSGDVAPEEASWIRLEFDAPGAFSLYRKNEYSDRTPRAWHIWSEVNGDRPPSVEFEFNRYGANTGYNSMTAIRLDRLSYSPLVSTSYRDWLAARLASSGIALQSDYAHDQNADTDGDGIPNFLEYLFDLDPFGESAMPTLSLESRNGAIKAGLEGRFIVNEEYSLLFETSRDLRAWQPIYPLSNETREANMLFREFDIRVMPDSFVRWSVVPSQQEPSQLEGK